MEGSSTYRFNDRNFRIAAAVVAEAEKLGVSAAQLSLAWILAKGVIPIIGARKLHQLEDNLDAVNLKVPADVIQRLDEASAIKNAKTKSSLKSRVKRCSTWAVEAVTS